MDVLVLLLMIVALALVIIPVVPVAAVEWAIFMIFGALTGFDRLTPAAALVATVFMVIGSTSQYWAPFLGLKGKKMSCVGILGFFVGAMLGTAVIPIPFVGTIIGGVIAVIAIEFLNTQDMQKALVGGKSALTTFVIGMGMELLFSVLIILTYVVSLSTSG